MVHADAGGRERTSSKKSRLPTFGLMDAGVCPCPSQVEWGWSAPYCTQKCVLPAPRCSLGPQSSWCDPGRCPRWRTPSAASSLSGGPLDFPKHTPIPDKQLRGNPVTLATPRRLGEGNSPTRGARTTLSTGSTGTRSARDHRTGAHAVTERGALSPEHQTAKGPSG